MSLIRCPLRQGARDDKEPSQEEGEGATDPEVGRRKELVSSRPPAREVGAEGVRGRGQEVRGGA